MIERKLFDLCNEKPGFTSPEESQKIVLEAIAQLQKVERNYMGREEVTVAVHTNDPIMVVCGSDLHAGSISTDHDAILELRDYVLAQKNAGMVLLGDEVEGLKEAYMNTNTARTPIDFHKQIDFLREAFLKPLSEQGKVLAMVSGYWGHPGWAEDASTINTWRMMTDGLDIPILINGGRLNIKFPNSNIQSMTIWHNPPGKSKYDPVKGLRDAAFSTSESNRTDGFASGHIHKMAVGKELYSGAKKAVYFISSGTAKGSSEKTPQDRFGIKLGAPRTDPMGQGVILESKRKGQQERNYPYASLEQGKMAFDALRILDKVEKQGMTKELLEKIRAEVQSKPKIRLISGMSRVSGDEYMEDRPVEQVKVSGEWVTNPYSKMMMRAPYDSLTYDIESKLPVALHLISNARLGSSSEGFDDLKKYHQELIAGNPHSLVVFLRNMIDKDAGKSSERMMILDRFKEIINGAKDQTLAIMMCESLRSSSWRSKVKTGEEFVDSQGNVVDMDQFDNEEEMEDDDEEGQGSDKVSMRSKVKTGEEFVDSQGNVVDMDQFDNEEEMEDDDEEGQGSDKVSIGKIKKRVLYSMPIAPGSYLANETDTPLIHHLSLIKLTVGPRVSLKEKPLYVGAFADKLLRHGSYSRPEFGLRRLYDLYTQEKPGYVAGGHMPHAGSMMFYDRSNAETDTPILVAPGWFAKYVDTMGKGNVMPGALPGQAIIFMPGEKPDKYLAFPTVNADETGYMQDALTLLKGLEILGLTDKVLKNGSKRSK